MSDSRIGVVTVTYNSNGEIAPFLDSVEMSTTEPVDVVVVDNSSPDSSLIRSASEIRGAQFVQLDENRGYGGGVNAGFARLSETCRFVLISNPDVILSPASLDVLVRALLDNPKAGSAGPRILTESGAVYPSARELPSLSSGVGHALFARIWPANPWTRRYHNDVSTSREDTAVGWLSGACLLVRREAFEAVGGFDEAFFMYFEDVDLGRRLRSAGWENHYVPGAEVVHMGARSTSQDSGRMLEAHHSSAYLFLCRRYPRWYQRPVREALRLGLWLRLRWALFRT